MAKKSVKIPGLLVIGVISAVIVLFCMGNRYAGDFYAMHIYPWVSAVLSLLASPFRFSLQFLMILLFFAAFVWIIVNSYRKKQGFLRCFLKEFTLIVWIFVWSYLGWCLNYSRSPITSRLGLATVEYDSTAFRAFLTDFTEEMNALWVSEVSVDENQAERSIKDFYASVPEKYGLCQPKKWHHPKKMPFQRIESGMGISGYFGPLFCESHLNYDVPAVDLYFTFAHEYSHLLGISSEAEANWWAFQCCRSSDIPEMKYSAYLYMLSSVAANASRLLSEDEYRQWTMTIRTEVKDDYDASRNFWKSMRIPMLDKAQGWIYDLYLKGNNIPSGMKNYSEAVGLLMSLPDFQ